MERARHRKTKSASGIEGVRQIQKQKACPRLSSDSRSYIDGSNRDDKLMLQLGQGSLRGATGIPMKKLLAEEMSKNVEAKRRTPSIVAKLMGFEGLPSPRLVHRQEKSYPENLEKNAISFPRNNQLHDSRSNKGSSMDQQEFKDVYEDLEASHVVNRRCSSRWSASSILTKPEMALIQQKFIDAKRLSTDEKLQDSKELDDTLEMLDSNKELLLKFLGQQDSLFVKHLHDLQADPGSSRIAVLKPSNSEKYESKAKEWRSERDTSSKPHVAPRLRRKDGLLLEPHNRSRAHTSRNPSRIQVEEMNDENMLPTRIVVLKPNLGKIQNAGTSSSPDLSHGHLRSFKKMKEYPSVGGLETVSRGRKSSSHNAGLSKTMSQEAREMAREITMRMRNGCNETMDAKSAGYRGYVGDESSYDGNDSDSESEPEVFKLSSRRRSFDDNNFCRYPSSRSGESSMNKEAKKGLSERWKMTHKYQDLEMVSRSSTLGEMLALPDKGTTPNHLNTKANLGRTSNRLGSINGAVVLDGPLGISSSDGWKDEICRHSSRSRSLPPPTGGRGRSHRRISYHDKLAEDKRLMHNETVHFGKSKDLKGNLNDKVDNSHKDLKSRSKKSHTCQQIFTNEKDFSSEANLEIQMESNAKELSEQQFQMPEEAGASKIPAVDLIMISEPGSTTMPSESSEVLQKQLPSSLGSEKTAARNREDSNPQELCKGPPTQGSPASESLGAELDSSESCKEADHPSPNSVLQVPFAEDTSSSESFERVSAELQELRMQLKLLKMESGTYTEPSTLHPIEEESTQPSPTISEWNYAFGADSWKSCYALDVLIHSGLEDSDFDMSRAKWHSLDCLVDPTLFDNLEKKYNEETSGSRPERRLLFDRINSTLSEIFQERIDLCPWVMRKLAGSSSKWGKEGVRDALEKLIVQDMTNKEMSDRELDREMLWSDSKGEIEVIGNEIETLLIDDMITEVLCN